MNSDFNLKGVSWKKVIALVLCLTMLVPSSSVFAAGKSSTPKMQVTVGTKGSASGNAYALVKGGTYEYTGKVIKPEVTVVSLETSKEISSKYYTVKYGTYDAKGSFTASSPKDVGHYYGKITFKGKYKKVVPQVIFELYISPKTVELKSVNATGKDKCATVKWIRQAKANVTKYEVGYSHFGTFAKDQHINECWYGTKTAKNTASSLKIKGYYPINYYVRVRAYKTVKYYSPYGSQYKETIYSDWSSAKKVKLK